MTRRDRHRLNWLVGVGPGIVFALSIVGPGDLASNTAVGATYGYAMIWVLALSLLFRYVWLRTSARFVLITGQTLIEGYQRIGRWLVYLLLAVTLIASHFTNLYMLIFAGDALSTLLPFSSIANAKFYSTILMIIGVVIVIAKGYPLVEKSCLLIGCVLGGALIIAATSARPDLPSVLKGILLPSLPGEGGFYGTALLISALVGTEAGAVSNLMYAYLIQEKGWRTPADLSKQRWDLILSISAVFFFGALIQITGAATFYETGTIVEDSADLMELMSHTGSSWLRVAFLLSFCAVAFSSFIGFTEGKSLMAADMVRLIRRARTEERTAGISPGDKPALPSQEADRTFQWIVLFLGFSPAYFLVTEFRPVFLALAVSAFYTALIPILAGGLLWITNDPNLMRGYVNRWWVNLALGLLILISLFLTGQNLFRWLG